MEHLKSFRGLVESCIENKLFSVVQDSSVELQQQSQSCENDCKICVVKVDQFVENFSKSQNSTTQKLMVWLSPVLQVTQTKLATFVSQRNDIRNPNNVDAKSSMEIPTDTAIFCIKLVEDLLKIVCSW